MDGEPRTDRPLHEPSALLVDELAYGGTKGSELAYRVERFGNGVDHV
jgi:hypothetical protein